MAQECEYFILYEEKNMAYGLTSNGDRAVFPCSRLRVRGLNNFRGHIFRPGHSCFGLSR